MSKRAIGKLVEYNLSPDAIVLPFQYNPESMARTRGTEVTINNTPGTGSSFAFATPMQTPRIMQSAKLQDETLSVEVLFSAGDYMDREGFSIGATGLQPVLDSLRLLVEPRSQQVGGLRMMSELGLTGGRAFERDVTPSVVLFYWGAEVLPVVMKTVSYTVDEFLPSLAPIKCTAQLSMQVIEAHNPFIFRDRLRQQISSAVLKGKPGFEPASALFKQFGG
ncbi:hypothetical protein [Falsihalocynthiibacter arcticus]|uniref:Uncharacterized protein n=1 Tax=Falsihalocynthiibacter arcticus TaxID=1579316 RepID=A0A126V0V6_9RHOB|nr:hypothetical protein [Falsihalocynthiibacter arcticus]AML51924.1 hypothetical protein RC74_12190 [Falsihalocynthiibacter arcticus]